eukprot:Rhum_TRINITY_DN14833_c5_g2::Rhum_TRINITY_DN14833_c5_g2_i1::g.124509::m.124509
MSGEEAAPKLGTRKGKRKKKKKAKPPSPTPRSLSGSGRLVRLPSVTEDLSSTPRLASPEKNDVELISPAPALPPLTEVAHKMDESDGEEKDDRPITMRPLNGMRYRTHGGNMRRVQSACAGPHGVMASSDDDHFGMRAFDYNEPDSDAEKRLFSQTHVPRARPSFAVASSRMRRAQSTGQLPPEPHLFFKYYSKDARSLLRHRHNSHFLPSSSPLEPVKSARSWVQCLKIAMFVLQSALSVFVIYMSFSNISTITYWNPYLKVVHYSGRMLFPVLDGLLGATIADYWLWAGSQLGYYRALGRFSGTYRKLTSRTPFVPEGADELEQVLSFMHWVFDFLYFPTEHLALVEWEAAVFGIKSKVFFERINAVVWYWRQVFMVCLLAYSLYYGTLALEPLATTLYVVSTVADLLCAYSFLPTAKKRYSTYTGRVWSLFYTRNIAIGLGIHGFFGVADGLAQIGLRWVYYTAQS